MIKKRLINFFVIFAFLSCTTIFPLFAATLYGYAAVSGVVRDKNTSQPIANAQVSLVCGTYTATAVTNAVGSYQFTNIPIYSRKGTSAKLTATAASYVSLAQTQTLTPSKSYTMNFALSPLTLSVSVSPATWNIGNNLPGVVVTMANKQSITVVNNGNVAATYSLNLIDPANWQASQSQVGPNIYILDAAFASRITSITWNDANHALSLNPVLCTAAKFAGNQTGVNVAVNASRILWLRFKAPTSTKTSNQQTITVVVTAQLP